MIKFDALQLHRETYHTVFTIKFYKLTEDNEQIAHGSFVL